MFNNFKRNALVLAAGAAICAPSAHAFVVNDTFAGNWGDVDGGSRGLIIDILENRAPAGDFAPAVLVEWFTYDEDGNPLWLISNTAQIDRDTNTASLQFLEFAGGAFATPDLGSPSSSAWGSGTLTFNSCNEAVLEFDGANGTGTTTFTSLTESTQCVVDEVFSGCPDFASAGPVEGSCIIGGGDPITDDITLTNETTWLIQGQFVIGNGGSVTIEPNTELVGGTLGDLDTFIVAQGGKVFAEGTQENPIVMRGFLAQGRGEWGGVVVNGFAPINGCAEGVEVCTAQGEGNSGTYGGNDPDDSSGVFRYLIVSNAGILFNEENELNGIAFQGVGRGTTIEYVQVHLNTDDGIEFFGGTANAKRLVLTGIGDDSLDWTQGWQGKVQYLVAKQYTDDGDQGIEADNNGDANDSLPRALPFIANATFIGAQDTGWLIREGTGVAIANSIVTGFGDACVDIDQESTFNNSENLTFNNNIIGNCGGGAFDDEAGDPFLVSDFVLGQLGNVQADPMLNNYIPMPGSPALNVAPVPFTDSFFDNVNYAGAVPSQGDDWTKGWTVGLDRDAP
ncbi:hypothetical protein HFP89_00515 [Wenzhouxiangella sp. XN79A]|uniref:hypothetical protein n=1 Tax=Wenzhouxiangella sp. XN79A TaxID=2724193 RepID=UPI00144ABB2F|nr:hypothetical protein [Wenzhouxiangella sp. XN79A]NKI33646.1 hypothetical protein [Wenzhouxiangella sp. XN79A]